MGSSKWTAEDGTSSVRFLQSQTEAKKQTNQRSKLPLPTLPHASFPGFHAAGISQDVDSCIIAISSIDNQYAQR